MAHRNMNVNRMLPSIAIENAIRDLLDLKVNPEYGRTKHGRAYTVMHLVTIVENVCRLVRTITPEHTVMKKYSITYKKELLLDALSKYDAWAGEETMRHECVVNEHCPGDEVDLSFGELQDLVNDACVHYIEGIARHVEASGNTYQSMYSVRRVMSDLLGSSILVDKHLDEIDELFNLRHLLIHTLDWEVQNASGFVDVVYNWLSCILNYDPIRREFNTLQFHVGLYHIDIGQYDDAVNTLKNHVTTTKHDDIDAVDEYNLARSYYHLAVAHKQLGDVESAKHCVDKAIELITASLDGGILLDADDLFGANAARSVCKIGVLSRSLDENGGWPLLYDLATDLCDGNDIAFMDLTHEFKKANEGEYATDCFNRMEEMRKSVLSL